MDSTIAEDMDFQISNNFILHRFGNDLFIYDTKNDFSQAKLGGVEADIVLAINSKHNVKAIWDTLRHEYNIADEDEGARSVLFSFLRTLSRDEMITKGRREAPILGEAGKFFPITVSFELTNKCNLRCSHCYKEAQVQNNAFIPTDLALKILGQLSKNVWHLEFTGGEATLHPEFEKIVAAASAPSMVLLTNGTNLQSISSATLSRFNLIQVSLYGSSREEYEEYTETAAFDNVCKGITRLVDLGVPCCVAVILRKTNILRLGTYIQLLDELGVADVRFGFSAKVGRNSNGSTDWDLEYEDCVQFDTIIQKLKSEYSNIHFSEFGWRDQFKTNFPIKDSYKIGCEAGKKTIAISERGYVRPCVYMPAQFFERKTWDEYYKIISNGRMLDTAPCVADCLNAFREVGQSLSKICPRAFI